MQRSGERVALAGALLGLVAAVIASTEGWEGAGLAALHLWAAATCAVVAARAYFARRAREEAEDIRRARAEPSPTLFEEGGGDTLAPMGRSAAAFERWVVPWVAPLLGAAALAVAVRGWRSTGGAAAEELAATLAPAARHGATAFVLLVAARYLLSSARQAGNELLRGAGAALGAAAFGTALVTAGALGRRAGFESAEAIGRAALAIWTGVLGAEQVIRALLELYRPRRPDESPPAPYESALTVRLFDPASWWRAAAESVDYQFGFEFSRTQAARRIARALVPYLVVQAAVLYGWTCVTILGPDEEGVRERFGRPVAGPAGHLGPGWHWTWPWPFETVRRAPARRVLHVSVGFEGDDEVLPELLWSRPHYRREDLFLSAVRSGSGGATSSVAPVSVLSINLPIEYRVTNVARYVYGAADPTAVLRAMVNRALTAELAGRDVWEVLGPGQAEFGQSLVGRIRRDVGRLDLGVEVTFVGLRGAHPPVEVAEAFEDVVAAIERREAAVLKAKGDVARIEADAAASARARRTAAEAARDRRVAVAAAEADRFRSRRKAAVASPLVYSGRAALDAVRAALARPRLYLVATSADREVVQLNLEPKVASVLWDIGVLTNRGAAAEAERTQESGR